MRWIAALYLLSPLTCRAGAIYLMVLGKDGWGWLLVVAVILATGFSYSDKNASGSLDR